MMETNAPGLHDAILLCAGIAAVYLVVALLQLMQLKHPRSLALPAREPSVQLPMGADAQAADDSFANQLKQRSIEAEVKRLRQEVDNLRTELRGAREDIKLLRNDHGISMAIPLYNEAINFAKRGFDATGIAARCGISRGEAELVAALARGPDAPTPADESRRPSTATSQHQEQHDRYRAAA